MPSVTSSWIALLMALGILAATAQDPGEAALSLHKWGPDDGLPHNAVNGILQRADGFLWVATQGGLVRFDGVDFVESRSPLLTSPRSSRILELIEENPSTLLVACDVSGLVRLKDGELSVHPLSEAFMPGGRILSLFQEDADVFWVLTEDRQLWRWDHGRILHMEAPAAPGAAKTAAPGTFAKGAEGTVYIARGDGLECFKAGKIEPVPEIAARSVTIAPALAGGLWVASSDTLWHWLAGGALEQMPAGVPWSAAPPTAMLEDREGVLWIATRSQGLFQREGEGFPAVPTSHAWMTSLHQDHEGNIWAGTAVGLNLIQPARFRLLNESSGWISALDGGVCEGPQGDLWFASSGMGLRSVSGNRIQPPPPIPGWPGKAIAISVHPSGDLWVGANNQLGRIPAAMDASPQWLSIPGAGRVHAIHITRDGTVWAGGEIGLLVSVTDGVHQLHGAAQGYTGKQAQVICEDSRGDIWVGTEDGEIFTRGSGGLFTRRELPAQISGSGIRALLADKEGNVWAGTGGAGLLLWRDGHFSMINELQGLADDVVSQLLEDDFGFLWFGTSCALFKVNKAELLDCAAGRIPAITPVKYGRDDGVEDFSASANYQPAAWKTRDGRLLFVSRNGLVVTSPGQQPMERRGPRVHIDRFTVDGKTPPAGGTKIPSVARKLDFQFTAPTFVSPRKVRFRYRLDGLESEWNEASTVRTASYARLAPGKYRFEVMACNSDLVWNPRAAIFPFEVVPAWWETWWARGLAMFAGAGLLTVAVRYWSHQRLKARLLELEATRRIDMERSRIARDLHDGLGAGLTQIGMMAEELSEDVADLQEMKSYSARIAGRVRGIARDLDAAVWTVSPKNDTLAALASYIGQYAIEYFRETPVRCRVDLPQDIPAAPLSPDVRHHLFLMAKEIMNNVLKHSGANHVTLAIRTAGDRFHLEIADDGHGFPSGDAAVAGRHGLQNIRERVVELGGTLDIRSSGTGTAIAIQLPLPKS